jgi:4-hydroxy-tetrahydrodipicolinate reductase
MPTTLAIFGAAGRMGQRLIALASEDPGLRVVAAIDRTGHPRLGDDAGVLAGVAPLGVALAGAMQGRADAIIDFSHASALHTTLDVAVKHRSAVVIGTTGLGAEHQAELDHSAHLVPVLQATNFSLVVNVLNKLAADAARLLGPEYDIEILEAHHRFKKDAPSGTAMTLAKVICNATGRDPARDVKLERHGDDVPRQPNEITVQTLRIGDHPGEHTVFFAALGERLELKHVSTTRDSYARGALHAAKWLAPKQPGRYTMPNVLGIA